MSQIFTDKLARCREIIAAVDGAVVAFSGGVDSSVLLALAVEQLGRDAVQAVTAIGAVFPSHEVDQARAAAERLNIDLTIIDLDHLAHDEFRANTPQRCYVCKTRLLERLSEEARPRGWTLMTGSIADDAGDYRPGARAEKEWNVVRPLAEAGLTKDEIRAAAREMALPTAEAPSLACLATRIPYGQEITAKKLERIDSAERELREMGFGQLRVRDHEGLARIELAAEEIPRATLLAGDIAAALRAAGFDFVALDLEGYRTGSMNRGLPKT